MGTGNSGGIPGRGRCHVLRSCVCHWRVFPAAPCERSVSGVQGQTARAACTFYLQRAGAGSWWGEGVGLMPPRAGSVLAAALAVGLVLSVGSAALAAPVGALKQFKVPAANSQPRAITNGSDGNRWFTEGTDSRPRPPKSPASHRPTPSPSSPPAWPTGATSASSPTLPRAQPAFSTSPPMTQP